MITLQISCQRIKGLEPPKVAECLAAAKSACIEEEVLGSDDKDVINSRHFRVAGAEVDSSERTIKRIGCGLCPC